MPSRSRSPSGRRSSSLERHPKLPKNVSPISESDYFQKADEFRVWLKDEKGKYFVDLSGDKARSYFRKFVKAWNRGKLPDALYVGIDTSTVPQTAYKWNFASKSTKADEEALRAAREEISAETNLREPPPQSGSGTNRGRVQGPTLPSASDLALSREIMTEQQEEERMYKRKRDKLEAKERVEDMVGPREVGREGMLEKKRARREADKSFREKGDEGLEVDESTLLGDGDSFKRQIARRDAAKRKHEAAKGEKTAAIRERATMMKQKEQATMDMFQQLAKQRFG